MPTIPESRTGTRLSRWTILLMAGLLTVGCATQQTAREGERLRGTGDLGVVVERGEGALVVVDTTERERLGRIEGLGDLSHASVVFGRAGRYAYVFGRDGGLTKVDLLNREVAHRIRQAGNSIGGAISQNGKLVAVSNYEPGGVRVFRAEDLSPVAEIPATYGPEGDKRSKVVGLVDAPGNRFVFSLYEAGELWSARVTADGDTKVRRYRDIGDRPYDGLITPGGRYYLAGLYGEDGLALLDLWHPEQGVRQILEDYGRGDKRLPVYKMPHLEGWAQAGDRLFLPAVGRKQLLVVDGRSWQHTATLDVHGQPVFAVARPDGRQVWVNYAYPDNDTVQVIDVPTGEIVKTLHPGKGILHMEFTPRGHEVWVSARDSNEVVVYDTATFEVKARLPARTPSGIFFTSRAHRIGL